MSVETDLTALLRQHDFTLFTSGRQHCRCGWNGYDHNAHLASVVSAAYTLTPKGADELRIRDLEQQVIQSATAMTFANLDARTAWSWVDKWRAKAKVEDDLRGWLRLCTDDPEGHAEFYAWASHLYFGTPPPEETP